MRDNTCYRLVNNFMTAKRSYIKRKNESTCEALALCAGSLIGYLMAGTDAKRSMTLVALVYKHYYKAKGGVSR